MTSKNNILKNLFDIKPVDETGQVDVEKICRVRPVIDLGNLSIRVRLTQKIVEKSKNPAFGEIFVESQSSSIRPRLAPNYSIANPSLKSNVDNEFIFRGLAGSRTPETSVLTWISNRSKPTAALFYDKKQNSAKLRNFGGSAWDKEFPVPSTSQQKVVDKPILAQLENYLNSNLNVRKELRNIGGRTVVRGKIGKPRVRPIPGVWSMEYGVWKEDQNSKLKIQDSENDEEYQLVLARINERIVQNSDKMPIGEMRKIDPVSLGMLAEEKPVTTNSEIESWANYARSVPDFQATFKFRTPELRKIYKLSLSRVCRSWRFLKISRKNLLALGVVGFSALIFTSFSHYGISVKNEALRESNSAVANLEQAGESLQVFDFEAASSNFAQAYGEFSKAGESLNFMGASITSLLAEFPGFDKLTAGGAGKLKSAKNLVEAGKLVAEAGKSMSDAVRSLSETGLMLDPDTSPSKNLAVGNTLGNLRNSLIFSKENLAKTNTILSDIDPNTLPEDKKEAFLEFKSKLPEFENLASDALAYTNFLEDLVGVKGTKKYLILFQNNSELRPTGGFPGSYAVVTFKDGRLQGFSVDDVYNLDGQIKEDIVPPFPLQHITPTWGMRDANWFIDFSVSAQKIMEFFNKEAGYEVDGVITISPRIIAEILKVVGPIEMADYDMAIDHENFVSAIQTEVEYGENREQPKKILTDIAPLLLEKIYSSEPSQWLSIFNAFVSGLDKKDILMYFKDLSLENFVAEKEFGGLVKNVEGDYLMVTLSNVKGSKTDRVTENYIKVSTQLEESRAVHKLELTRQHNGGSTRYGFYNKQNPAFVRILVPGDAEIISISGNSNPNFKPLVDYSDDNFKQDKDLTSFESGFNFDSEKGIWTYGESGKKGFAFWMITDPGKTKTVELEYFVPLVSDGGGYNIYVQKQPGLEVKSFEFKVGDTSIYNGEFDKDLGLTLYINKHLPSNDSP